MRNTRPSRRDRVRNRRGTNQYQVKRRRGQWTYWLIGYAIAVGLLILFATYFKGIGRAEAFSEAPIVSPVPHGNFNIELTAEQVEDVPSEKELIVAYITRLWEKHGTDQVVRAINCFYSESGLRSNAVGQNSDGPRSKDHGVAQLNDYWHELTEEQKTDIYANLDKAYEIYLSRGNWSAWYGANCN